MQFIHLCICLCLHLQKTSASSDDGSLEGVVEQLTRFRSEVRAFALARHDSTGKAGLSPDRIPLLKACDALRNDLAPLGVILKVFFQWKQRPTCTLSLNVPCLFVSLPRLQDRGAASTWEITAPTPSQKAQDEDQDRSTRDRPSDSNKSWIVSLSEWVLHRLIILDCRTSVTLMAGYQLEFNAVFDLYSK